MRGAVVAAITEPTRRQFLVHLSGLGLLLSHPMELLAQGKMPTRVIPVSGEALPVIGFGSTKAVRLILEDGPDPISSVLRMLLRYGGRVVDSSPRTEEIDAKFGEVLSAPEFVDTIFLATKINTTGKDAGIQQMRQNQRLFRRRTMDLVQIESLTDLDTHWPSLLSWKASGETRYIGVTTANYSGHDRLEAFMKSEKTDFVHVNYSVMEPRAEERLLPLARDRGVAVLVNRPFMNGEFLKKMSGQPLPPWTTDFDCKSWAQFSLKYILANPSVTCVFTETTDPGHMEENAQAAFGRLPDEPTRKRMRELVQSV